MIDPFSAVSIASSGITVTTSPDYLLDALTASYVLLTLALAIIAFRSLRQTQSSLDLTRHQIELNAQQSQEASAASERHSQATIDAVNRQIEASERQAQEALYNQQKPVLVPVGGLGNIIGTSDGKLYVKWGYQNQVIGGLRNAGVGPALNIYGILFGPPLLNSQPPRERYVVWNHPALTPGATGDEITLIPASHISSDTSIKGYTLYVPDDVDHVGILARFTLTYHDVFGRKHASIYDYHSRIGWISRGHFSAIEKDIYELDRETPGTKQSNQFFYNAGKREQQ